MLVDLMVSRRRVDNSISALTDSKGHKFLPLRRIGVALGFRFRVDTDKKLVTGFLGTPKDRLEIDGVTGVGKRSGSTTRFGPSLCFVADNDLYLDADIVTQLLGVRFDWNLSRMEVEATPDAPLPLRRQYSVQRLIDDSDRNRYYPQADAKPILAPAKFWSPPALDLQLRSTVNTTEGQDENSMSPSLEGTGDFLFMTSRYRLATDGGGRPYALLTFERTDLQSGLLGPLKAKKLSVGDLALPAIPLLARGRIGYGLSATNFPLPGDDSGAGISLDGTAPPGTVVELYRDNVLVAAARTDHAGTYVLKGLRLEPGPNDMRIVVIGPDGVLEEVHRTLYGDAVAPKVGMLQYRFTLAQRGRTMFGMGQDVNGGSSSQMACTEFRTGFSSGSWFSLTGAQLNGTGSLGLGLHSWAGGSYWHADTMASEEGTRALSFGIARKFGLGIASLEHVRLSGGIGSGVIPEIGQDATMATKLRLEGIARGNGHSMSYGLAVDRYDGNGSVTDLRARMSTSLGSFFITNTTLSRFSDRPADAAGLLQIRKQVGTSATKFEFGYGWGANRAFQLARVSHDKRLSADYRYHIGLEDDATRSQPLALIGAVYKMVGPLALGVNVSMNPSGLKAGLMLSTSVGAVGSSEGYALAKPGSANQSQVQARVFLDNNLSGAFDKGDTLLPDVRFKADGHGVTGKTGAKGTCVLNKLESDRRVCLSLNEDSFEDPSWMSVGGPFVVLPRAGARVKVDFPVIATAEIDGRATGPKSGPQSYSGFKATLVSSKGVASYSSELDSEDRFVFSRVVPGVYTMRLEDPQGIVVYEDMFSVQSGEIVSGFNLLVTAAKLPKSYGGSRPDSELPAPEGPPPPAE